MKYGLIGEKLSHSFSKEIHALIGDYPYELCEIAKSDLHHFLKQRSFDAVNVTIPYKQSVIPYVDELSLEARKIGAVNLLLNRGGKLFGFNTDYYGAKRLIERANVQVKGKKALILGAGGTKQTLFAVLSDLGAKEIITVSRRKAHDYVTYDAAKTLHKNAELIINATPVGMYPNFDEEPIDLDAFPNLSGAIDVIYNPIRTNFIEKARARGIPCANGMYMLAAQAVKASEIMRGLTFTNTQTETLCEDVYEKVLRAKQNVVLIGMPTCGKSSIGSALAKMTGRVLYDTDALTQERTGKTACEIIETRGEQAFRIEEKKTIRELAGKTQCIISTGGGSVLDEENVRLLKKNGKLFFLDRPLSQLFSSADRPLSSNRFSLETLYNYRRPIYLAAADVRLKNDSDIQTAASQILDLL